MTELSYFIVDRVLHNSVNVMMRQRDELGITEYPMFTHTEVEEISASRIKQSLTGHGHASKSQMQRAVQHTWNLPEPPEPPDVADALAVALCCGRASFGGVAQVLSR